MIRNFIFAVLVLCSGKPGLADEWPVEIANRYGTTRIDAAPTRVVSLSYVGHDFLLSLGVRPIAVRHWYGDHPHGVWPWAMDALGDARPEVLRGDINVERIARLAPDLIVGQWSGMTAADYALLSRIAPTLAPAPGQEDYSSPWQLMLERLGRATGRADQADATRDALLARFARFREEFPDWAGRSAVAVAPAFLSAFTARDIRGQLLAALGLEQPLPLQQMAGQTQFYAQLPSEDLSPVDADVLIWLDTNGPEALLDLPLRPTLRAAREGREIFADTLLTAAISHSSPLSLDYALDRLVPLIAAAIDGDPSTKLQAPATSDD